MNATAVTGAVHGGTSTPEQLLARFGLEQFRPGQREAVQAALDGRDSLVVMPTGGGKSLCYQLPALADVGLVVVVSPLIALMADQLRRLEEAGVRAGMLASGMADGHNERALREVADGSTQLILVAPERFASGAFRAALAERPVGLFVVDEAHCVAEWGHDFRPDYLRLHDAIASLSRPGGGRPPVMAATATATPRVAREIAERLELAEPLSVRSGFDRPNLVFDVVAVEGKGAVARKRAALSHVLSQDGALPAIVYCGTRKDTDDVASRLAGEGLAAVAYHAGMGAEKRRDAQARFMDGRADVIVATNAFGMGVDKAGVRTVAHWALPTSLEAYYQEAGRGGRDGEPARALLLSSRMDLGRLIRFINERETAVDDVRGYVARLRSYAAAQGGDDSLDPGAGGGGAVELTIGHDQLRDDERVLLSIAERAGAVTLRPGGRDGLLVQLTGRGSPRLAAAAIKAARDRAWDSYRSIERYSSAGGGLCRRRAILDHFGDSAAGAPSGRCCDVCDPDEALIAAVAAESGARSRVRRGGRAASGGSEGRASAGGRPGGAGGADELVDEGQFERLRAWRLERSEGKPAFTVASDATLCEILVRRPSSLGALIDVRGIGPSFCEKHGASLLEELAALGAT
jgi:ATP-dependent DNA helicase RecQ